MQRDVIVLCNNPTHKFINFTLSVITEILSSSTALRDRNLKFWLYQNEGIKYYLIADADAKKIKIYQLVYKIYKPVNENAAEHVEFLFDEDCRPNVNLADG